MSPRWRCNLSAAGFLALVAVLLGGAVASAFALRDAQAQAAALEQEARGLREREARLGPVKAGEAGASPFFEAPTITSAGAQLQERVAAAVAQAGGRLSSSKVDVGVHSGERRLELEAELAIGQPEMQRLLFDLEIGRPYLFVESFEARAPETAQAGSDMRVALKVSGRWGGAK